jgi:hypothetical protein
VQIGFAEIYILCLDMDHLAHSQPGSGQQEQDASLTVVLSSI